MIVTKRSGRDPILLRVRRFLHKPWHEKVRWVGLQWRQTISRIPRPVQLPFGAYFFRRNDALGFNLPRFESRELAFVERLLRPGMTVLDIGAHQGLYTLLASTLVVPNGRVFAFEPSPRERKALRLNVGLNRCKNVIIEELALGNEEGEGSLYVVDGFETGCNSLRPPALPGGTSPITVHVSSLDQWLGVREVKSVDFIKLDVEGGELSVLQGAQSLLEGRPRPVILAEVQDIRTQPWGYRASEIISYLSSKGYKWFSLSAEGTLAPVDVRAETFDGNFVACPEECELLLGN
jgi:FkbM family methyltransferase